MVVEQERHASADRRAEGPLGPSEASEACSHFGNFPEAANLVAVTFEPTPGAPASQLLSSVVSLYSLLATEQIPPQLFGVNGLLGPVF